MQACCREIRKVTTENTFPCPFNLNILVYVYIPTHVMYVRERELERENRVKFKER